MEPQKKTKPDQTEILIVEDSDVQGVMLKRILSDKGYKVAWAKNGAEGLALAQKQRPALIISDIMMPVMDGYQLCEKIKQSEILKDIPVILLTQLTEPEEVIRGLDAGANNYITKPYNADFLLSKVNSLLENPDQIRNNQQLKCVEFDYEGKHYMVRAGRTQLFSFLFSTYEGAVLQNKELVKAQIALKDINEHLEERVKERTKSLVKEIAQRKKAEEEIRESEEKLRVITASAGDAVMMIDDKGIITFWNEAAERVFGYTQSEAIGKELHKLIVPEKDYNDFVKGFKTFNDTGQGAVIGKTLELEARRKNGTGFFTEHTISSVKIKGKWHAIGVARDITERKKAEEAIASLAKFPSENPHPILRVTQNGVLLYANESSQTLLRNWGVTVGDCIPMQYRNLVAEVYKNQSKITIEVECEGINYMFTIAPFAKVGYVNLYGNNITLLKQTGKELIQSYEKLHRTLRETAIALSSALEMRDAYTAGHQRRVAQLACAIAGEIGISESQIEGIRIAGILHDIGKISIPSDTLSKPGKLSKLEFEIIKTHANAGYEILKDIEFPWQIAQFVLQHHEKMDGSGYPSGLSDDKILIEARILCVADVVEAMASHRPYRAALGIDAALEEITQKRGVLYDARVVDACIKQCKEKGFTFA